MAHMKPTHKDRYYLEDALQMETLCLTKCNVYADQCQNGAARALLENHIRSKSGNINRIHQMLQHVHDHGLSSENMQYQ